jgi:hypothetical protein
MLRDRQLSYGALHTPPAPVALAAPTKAPSSAAAPLVHAKVPAVTFAPPSGLSPTATPSEHHESSPTAASAASASTAGAGTAASAHHAVMRRAKSANDDEEVKVDRHGSLVYTHGHGHAHGHAHASMDPSAALRAFQQKVRTVGCGGCVGTAGDSQP